MRHPAARDARVSPARGGVIRDGTRAESAYFVVENDAARFRYRDESAAVANVTHMERLVGALAALRHTFERASARLDWFVRMSRAAPMASALPRAPAGSGRSSGSGPLRTGPRAPRGDVVVVRGKKGRKGKGKGGGGGGGGVAVVRSLELRICVFPSRASARDSRALRDVSPGISRPRRRPLFFASSHFSLRLAFERTSRRGAPSLTRGPPARPLFRHPG